MFTSIDKAIVAIVMGVLSLLNLFFGWAAPIDPATLQIIITALTPLFVWWVPNKPSSSDRLVGRAG